MTRPRIVASIEARMGSSRLPGKVLADVCGKPAIERLVGRLRLCRSVDAIVLATTTNTADDALADWAARSGVAVFRGSEDDVLNRVVEAQKSMSADVVVEVTGDCVLTDPQTVDLGVETFLANDVDVVTNCSEDPRHNWPAGDCAQVFRLDALAKVEREIRDPAVREHVSLHFYEHPDTYRILNLIAPSSLELPGVRLQLDYPEDLAFLRAVWSRLEPAYGPGFGLRHIADLLKREYALAEVNRHCHERAPRG